MRNQWIKFVAFVWQTFYLQCDNVIYYFFLNSGIGGSHRSGGADHGRSYRPRSLDALPAEEEQKSRVERQREDDERRSK